MKASITLFSLLLGLLLGLVFTQASFAQEEGIPVTVKGKLAEQIFNAGDVEAELVRVEYSVGYEDFQVSNYGSFRCYKLVETSFGASFINGLGKRMTPVYQCKGSIYKSQKGDSI